MLAGLALLPLAMAQSPGTRERQIRAALVYKLARFVSWPGDSLPATAPVTFCYVSDEATSKVLAGIEGRAIQNRPARMRRLEAGDAKSIGDCNLIYLAGAASLTEEGRAATLASATLVVADGPRPDADGAMVQIVPRDNRVTLRVDLALVRAARLRIDATLLQLVEVRP